MPLVCETASDRRRCRPRRSRSCRVGRHAAAPGATPTNNVYLRTAHAGDNVDGGDQHFCIVVHAAVSTRCRFRRNSRTLASPLSLSYARASRYSAGFTGTSHDGSAAPTIVLIGSGVPPAPLQIRAAELSADELSTDRAGAAARLAAARRRC